MRDLIPVISPEQACEWLMSQDATLLDVRDAAAYHYMHIAGSTHVPAHELMQQDVAAFPHERVILACHDGQRSRSLYHALQRKLATHPDVMVHLHVLDVVWPVGKSTACPLFTTLESIYH